jgi:hypothetical protein
MGAIAGLTSVTIGGKAPSNNPPTYGDFVGNREMQIDDKKKMVKCGVVFGDNSSTYPSGGIPLSASGIQALNIPGSTTATYGVTALACAVSFGFRQSLSDLLLVDPVSSDGFVYKVDDTNLKLRIYQVAAIASGASGSNYTGAAAAPLVEVTTGFVPASGVSLICYAIGR